MTARTKKQYWIMGILSCFLSIVLTAPMMSNVVYVGETVGNRTCFTRWKQNEKPVQSYPKASEHNKTEQTFNGIELTSSGILLTCETPVYTNLERLYHIVFAISIFALPLLFISVFYRALTNNVTR